MPEPPTRIDAESPPKTSPWRARVVLLVKLGLTAGAVAFTMSRLSLGGLVAAVERISLGAAALAWVLTVANLTLAALRWRVLLLAYGARSSPSIAYLTRTQLVGHFYNMLVPGNVTGDVVRAHVTRPCFDGPLTSYLVVGVERFFGLAGLFTLGAITLLVKPLPGVVAAPVLAAFALGSATVIGVAPFVGRLAGRFVPGRIGAWLTSLPTPARVWPFFVAMAMSVVTHTIVALTGWLLVASVAPEVTLAQSFVLVPLAMVSTYLPSAVGGLGVREAAFTYVFGKVGVSAADATAASLALMVVYLGVAALGGVLHLMRPHAPDGTPEGAPPAA
jgi:hypothetical protein